MRERVTDECIRDRGREEERERGSEGERERVTR